MRPMARAASCCQWVWSGSLSALGCGHHGPELVEHVVVRPRHEAPVQRLEPVHQSELVERGQAVLCGQPPQRVGVGDWRGGTWVGPAPRWEYWSPDPVLSGLATLLAGVVAIPAPG